MDRLAGNGTVRLARRFAVSPGGMALQFAIAAAAVICRAEIVGMLVFLALSCAILVLCDTLLAMAPPLLLTSLFMIKSSDNAAFSSSDDTLYAKFIPLWWLVFIPVAAAALHIWLYRKPLKRGKAFWAILAVSAALTLGGLGSISAGEYFAGGALYHVGALGFGMLLVYVCLCSEVEEDHGGNLQEFASNLMVMLGLFACFMIFHHYLSHLPKLIAKPAILDFQWRNNVSTFLMLALPFPFYKAFQRPAWLLAGLLMYLGLLLSGSRGGLVFGTLELAMCVLFVLLADKKRRLFYLGLTVLLLVVAIAALPLLFRFLWPTVRRLLLSGGEQEARLRLYRRAVEDFLAHPVFGTGMGYMGNRDIHPSKKFALCWYHCAPLQIIGSMGVVGALAFAYQYVMRFLIFLRRRTNFHLTLFLSWVGVEMMSLVNPGVFAPVPYLLVVTMLVVFAEKANPGGGNNPGTRNP